MKKGLFLFCCSAFMLVISGCTTPGITKLAPGFLDSMRSTGKYTISTYDGHTNYGAALGVAGVVIEEIVNENKLVAERHAKCITAIEDELMKDLSIKYIQRSSLGISGNVLENEKTAMLEFEKKYGVNAFIRAELGFSHAKGLTKANPTMLVMWEVVSPSNEVMLKAITKVTSDEGWMIMPLLYDPILEPIHINLAKKSAEQFLGFLKSGKQ